MGFNSKVPKGESTSPESKVDPSSPNRSSTVEQNEDILDHSITIHQDENQNDLFSVLSPSNSAVFNKFRIFTIILALYVS
jgi:hypothetical protein